MNYELRIKNKGFTLIELLISVFLIVSVGTIVFSIFTSMLRGTKKASTINRIRENGDYAIAQMARNIQYAQIASTCGDPDGLDHVDLIAPGGESLTYACDSSNNITSSSATVTKQLIDINFAQVVSGTCKFVCVDSGVNSPKQIQIKFDLQNVTTSTNFVEDQARIPFRTSVTLRNFSQ